MQNIYNYDPQTGAFLGASQADESPLEPGVLLVPAFATTVAPPATQARQAAVFQAGAWRVSTDWRGVDLVNTATGAAIKINEIGVTPEDAGATEQPRPSTAHAWQNGAWVLDPALQAAIDAEAKAAVLAAFTAAIQARLDEFARTRNYDSILSACTYATSLVPKFQTEGQYCVEARDSTWVAAYGILAAVNAGTRPMPGGIADIEADLPTLVWPV